MSKDAQRSRKLIRKKGTVGAVSPPGTRMGYHDNKAAKLGRCECGRCTNEKGAT